MSRHWSTLVALWRNGLLNGPDGISASQFMFGVCWVLEKTEEFSRRTVGLFARTDE